MSVTGIVIIYYVIYVKEIKKTCFSGSLFKYYNTPSEQFIAYVYNLKSFLSCVYSHFKLNLNINFWTALLMWRNIVWKEKITHRGKTFLYSITKLTKTCNIIFRIHFNFFDSQQVKKWAADVAV